jgi:tRNA(Ile)-lysidine synthase
MRAGNPHRDVFSALDALPERDAIAVAVSGGADSMALLLLAQEWARARGARLTALTVDHRLRGESADEAREVGRWMAGRHIEHEILVWEHAPLRSAVEERAREARYRLLTGACRRRGIGALLLAHHAQDQAETFLLRLQSGYGADGLSGMSRLAERDGIRIVRPLLSCDKRALENCLRERGQPWLEDPSNADMKHARNRVRALLPRLEEAGIGVERLCEAAARYGQQRRLLDEAMIALTQAHVTMSDMGHARIDPALFANGPPDMLARILSRLIRTLGGTTPAPRGAELARAAALLRTPGCRGLTLGGCEFARHRESWLAWREPARVQPDVPLREDARWDNRYYIRTAAKGLQAGALGRDGLSQLLRADARLKPPALPRRALYALPCVKSLDEILYVPHIAFRHPRMQENATFRFTPRQPFPGGAFVV